MSDNDKDVLQDGERLKREAMERLERSRAAILRRCRRAMVEALLNRGNATTDDARDVVPIPAGIDPKLAGVIHQPLLDAGFMRAVSMIPTRRKIAHGRRIVRYALVDRDAAVRWLELHPVLLSDDQGDGDPRQRDLFE